MRALFVLVAITAPALAATPVTLAHSGFVLNASDVPLDAPAQAATFRLVDRAGAGESVYWSAACTIAVRSGYYAVELGAAPCTGSPALTRELLGTGEVFLEVVLGTVALTPRHRLAEAPRAAWAREAGTVGGVAIGGLVQKSELGSLPLAPGGTASASTFLRGDGAWAPLPAASIAVDPSGGLAGDGLAGGSALRLATGGVLSTHLASDALSIGRVSADALTLAGGRLGVGRTPTTARLEVAGGIKLGSESGACDTAAERGTIRFNGTSFQGCTAGGWVTLSAVADLTVATVSPASGPTKGGTAVQITGANFATPVAVTIGGLAATGVVFVSATTVTATVPPQASAGPKDVTVTTGDGRSATLTGAFTANASGESSGTAAASCLAIRNAGGSNGNGNAYWVNPAGTGAFQAYCDMVTDGGGWTLVGAFADMSAYDMYSYTASGRLPTEVRTSASTLRAGGSAAGQGPAHYGAAVVNALFQGGSRQYLSLTGTGSGGYVLARHTKTTADAAYDAFKGAYWTQYMSQNGFTASTLANTGYNGNPLPIASPAWAAATVTGRACAAPPTGVGCYHYLPDDIGPVGTGEWLFRENNDNTPATSYAGSGAVPNLLFIR